MFKETSATIGLKISEEKTKLLKVSRRGSEEGYIPFADMNLERVKEFKYLGSLVTAENKVEEEIKTRIAAGSRCLWSMNSIFKSRNLSRKTKLMTYVTIIRPIVMYGGETWRLTKELERKLVVFENGVLRRIWGPTFDINEGIWHRRHNNELRQLSELPLITNIIRSRRLQWAGHVARMEEGRMAKAVMLGKPEGRRPPGRPRLRWEDNVKRDLSLLGVEAVEQWCEVAGDRAEWRGLVEAAKDHLGPEPVE